MVAKLRSAGKKSKKMSGVKRVLPLHVTVKLGGSRLSRAMMQGNPHAPADLQKLPLEVDLKLGRTRRIVKA